jgi:uncharacterized membrane protein YkvA (DUF1232 family)
LEDPVKFLGELKTFIAALAADPRIPARDKALFTGLCAYLASPLDLIPDFIPVLGYADDVVVLALVLDYIFHVIPEPIILEHFPWPKERYHRMKRRVRVLSWIIPGFLRRRLWKQVRQLERKEADGP